nr:VOC family protein [Rhodanobacter sp. C03]
MMRVARACRDTEAMQAQYAAGLDLEVLSAWRDHEGFDGVVLGHANAPYHLEFIHDHHASPPPPPHEEQLLVFYLDDVAEWQRRCAAMTTAGFVAVRNGNPYWERNGCTFADAEGGRVVLNRGAWPR